MEYDKHDVFVLSLPEARILELSKEDGVVSLACPGEIIYQLCRRCVDRYSGENNSDMKSNGELNFLRKALDAEKAVTMFDVGANKGDWARAALSVNPSIRLHCFEPDRTAFGELQRLRWGDNVSLNNFGLSSSSGVRTLYIFGPGSGLNSLYVRHGLESRALNPQTEKETVVLRTLDDYCEEKGISNIHMLKVDVEGHELDVLRGSTGALKSGRISIIQFEYGGCNIDSRVLLMDLFAFLDAYKYRIFKIYPSKLRSIPQYDQRLENFQYANYVALAHDLNL